MFTSDISQCTAQTIGSTEPWTLLHTYLQCVKYSLTYINVLMLAFLALLDHDVLFPKPVLACSLTPRSADFPEQHCRWTSGYFQPNPEWRRCIAWVAASVHLHPITILHVLHFLSRIRWSLKMRKKSLSLYLSLTFPRVSSCDLPTPSLGNHFIPMRWKTVVGGCIKFKIVELYR